MADRPRVFVSQPLPAPALERLAAFADVDAGEDASRIMPRAELVERLRAADAFVHLMHDVVDAAALAGATRLRVIASMAIHPATLAATACSGTVARPTRRSGLEAQAAASSSL